MIKAFISQPMRDKTNEQIEEERARAINVIKDRYPDEEVEIIDSFFKDAPHDKKPVWFLGASIQKLAEADVAYFIGEWRNYRGCKIENTIANEYGIVTIEE